MDEFRRFFVRGLAALLPTLLTIALISWAYHLINDEFGAYITDGVMAICKSISDRPSEAFVDQENDPLNYGTKLDEWDGLGQQLTTEYKLINTNPGLKSPDKKIQDRAAKNRNDALWRVAFAKYRLHLLGFLIAIVLIYSVGFFLASLYGRALWRMAEGSLSRIPLVRAIYPNIKQVTDFLLSEKRLEYSSVVAVEYPRRGTWSVGLVTGAPLKRVQDTVQDELVTVFIPSSPTPVTGYVIQVARKDVIELDMSIDEGLRFTISGGVIKPGTARGGALPGR
jgi:uncharacterized membrane protein